MISKPEVNTDRHCADCEYYDWDDLGDICLKGHVDHVGWYSNACEDYKDSEED